MTVKAALSLPFAKYIVSKNNKWKNNAVKVQHDLLLSLVKQAKNTQFGKDHSFSEIANYPDWKNNVPVRDYEDLKGSVQEIIDGKENILWPGKPLYLCKTSGTTSGVKYIPISKESMPHHITAARDAILSYIAETKNTSIVNGKMIFLQGSPELTKTGDILTGRLSGIVAHHIPAYLTKNRLPSFETNCIADWETKVDAIVDETLPENMSLISGIPPWVQMYFEKLQDKTGKLWIGSFRSSTVTWFDEGKFTSVPFDKDQKLIELRFITEDKDGNVWFGGRYGLLWRYDGNELKDFTQAKRKN
jgi:hypothetical protein